MTTMKITKDNLRKASDHLFYEIWMMNQLATLLEARHTSIFVTRPTGYTHTTETSSFLRSTGIINTSKANIENDDALRVTNNAFIEAFGVHVRSLLDFFYSEGQEDDVVAAHFFESSSVWKNARPFKSKDDLKKIKNRVNKEIAHLTYSRQDVKSKSWPFREIQEDLNKVVEVFQSQVSEELLGDRWQ